MAKTKLLFICSLNRWRSLTAEKLLEKHAHYDVRSAGTESNARIKVTEGHIGWADMIFVMEKRHKERLQLMFPEKLKGKTVINLNISDDYVYMDDQLQDILLARIREWVEL